MKNFYPGCIALVLACMPVLLAGQTTFSNSTSISIPSSGNASPYPSTITVSGMGTSITQVRVVMTSFTHTFSSDIDILLVGPTGQSCILLSDAGSGNDLNGTYTFQTGGSAWPATDPVPSGTYAPSGDSDIWGSPAPSGTISNLSLDLFNSTNPNGVWSLYVVDDASGDLGTIAGGWSLIITATTPPPSNDNPCGAIALTANSTCSFATYTNAGATATTGPPAPGCASYLGGDVWFSVTVPASGSLIFDSNVGVIQDGGMAIYSSSNNTCSGTFTLIECDDDDSVNGLMPYISRTGLTPGSTIFIRFWEYSNDNNGTFSICVVAPPPANDNCSTATSVPVNAGTTCTSTVAGTTGSATSSATGCAGTADDDVWYAFTATGTTHTITVTPATTGGISDVVLQVYSGTCAALTSLVCVDLTVGSSAETTTLSTLTSGTTYYLRVYSYSSGTSVQGAFTICITSAPNPCTSITTLAACGSSATATLSGTGAGWSVTACGYSTPGQERLYSFTPTVTGTHTLQITSASGGYIDYFYKAASGGCSSTGWTCIDDLSAASSVPFGPLTAGVQYYILLDPEGTSPVTHTFQINCPPPTCVSAPSAPANGTSLCPQAVTLSWPSVTGATSYDVYYGTSASPAFVVNTTSTTYSAGTPTGGTYYWQIVPRSQGGPATGCSVWSFTINDPVGNTVTNPIIINSLPYTASGDNLTTNCWTNTYTGTNNQASPDVFYRLTTTVCHSRLDVSLCGTTFDTYLHVLNSSGGWIASNDDNGPLCVGTASSLRLDNLAPGTYFIVVEGYSSNSGTYSLSVTGTDITPPTITCPANVTLAANAACQATLASYTAAATVNDNCSTPTRSQSPAAGASISLGVNTVTLTATDAANNTAECTFTVTVADQTAPSVSCPGPQNVPTEGTGCTATLVDYTALGSASDNCTATPTLTQLPAPGTTLNTGTNTITMRATDAANNTGSCTFTVQVTDQTAPTINCPANATVAAGPACTAALSSYTNAANAGDNCGAPTVTQSPAANSSLGLGDHTVTLTATDGVGLTITCSLTVAVADQTPPSITCPPNLTVQASIGNCPATATFADATATDNCTAMPTVTNLGLASGSTFPAGTTTVTFEAADAAGNAATCALSVTVQSAAAPSYAGLGLFNASAGATDVQIVRVQFPASATCPGTVESVTFNTGSTTNAADIAAARVYYTTTTTFSAATPFGAAIIGPAAGDMTFTGTQTLSAGTGNYFWLVYDIDCNATEGNTVAATAQNAVISANTITIGGAVPAGINVTGATSGTPPTYVAIGSSTVTQGATGQQIVRVQVTGHPFCAAVVSEVQFSAGASNTSAIANARLYYTTTPTFSTAAPFGGDFPEPGGNFAFNDMQTLQAGPDNYFWLVYDIACMAPAGAGVTALPENIWIGGAPVGATGTTPPLKTVTAPTALTTLFNGSWDDADTWGGCVMPGPNTDVTINHAVTLDAAASIGSVTIAAGKSLTVGAAGQLTLGVSSAGAATGFSNKMLTVQGTLNVSGGTVDVNGAATFTASSTFNLSAGTLRIDPNDGTAATSAAGHTLDFQTAAINATAGQIVLLDPPYSSGSRALNYAHANTGANIAPGATVTVGGGDDANPANTRGFWLESNGAPGGTLRIGNLVVSGGRYAARRHASTGPSPLNLTKVGDLTVNGGAEMVVGQAALVVTGAGVANHGVITVTNPAVDRGLVFAGDAAYSASAIVLANSVSGQALEGGGFFKTDPDDADPTQQSDNRAASVSVHHAPGSGGLDLQMPLAATGTLRLASGLVHTTPTHVLTLGDRDATPATAGTLYTTSAVNPPTSTAAWGSGGGWTDGPFRRVVAPATTVGQPEKGLLPVGTATVPQIAQINFSTIPQTGTLTATFNTGVPGGGVDLPEPLTQSPGPSPITLLSPTGSWTIEASGGITAQYSAAFTARGFKKVTEEPIDDAEVPNLTLVKRPSGSSDPADWAFSGSHVGAAGTGAAATVSRSSMQGFSEFAVAGTTSALPIRLLSFTGTPDGPANRLDWITATEQNTAWFVIERSANGFSGWQEVGRTPAIGNSTGERPYTLHDEKPLARGYYRLRSVDADGSEQLSEIIVITRTDRPRFGLLAAYPSPVSDVLTVEFQTQEESDVVLRVTDLTSRTVAEVPMRAAAGVNTVKLPVQTLPAGWYLLTVRQGTVVSEPLRFVRQ